jgi:4-hydroxybenzoate polyprenyltransferase
MLGVPLESQDHSCAPEKSERRVISNPVLKEIVYGGHLLALGTVAIAACSSLLIERAPTFQLLLMAYLFSFGAYMLNRSSDFNEDKLSAPSRTDHLGRRAPQLRKIALLSFCIGYALAATTANMLFFLALVMPLVLALGYTVGSKRLRGLIGTTRLKERLLVKNLVTSFGWSLIPLLVGLYFQDLIGAELLAFAAFVFLRLMSNTIFFDVRDVRADSVSGVRTIPIVYGARKTYSAMLLIDLLSAASLIISVLLLRILPPVVTPLLVLPAYSVAYRYLAQKPGADIGFLCDVVADGEYLLWIALFVLGYFLWAK